MLNINTTEFMILAFIAIFIVGPNNMSTYIQKFAFYIKKIRKISEEIKENVDKEYPYLDAIQKYDPRQYDPRKIIQDTFKENVETSFKENAKNKVNNITLFDPEST